MEQFSASLLHPSRPACPSTTLGIQQWGCLNVQVLFVHSVHTHVCQKERLRCSITAFTAREHHRYTTTKKQQKKTAVCFLCSLSEVSSVQGWGCWEFLGEYILVAFQDFAEKAPISLWDYSTTKWSNEDPNPTTAVCREFLPPQSGINRRPDETAMKEDQFLYYFFFFPFDTECVFSWILRVDFPMMCVHNSEDKAVDHKVKWGSAAKVFSRIHSPNLKYNPLKFMCKEGIISVIEGKQNGSNINVAPSKPPLPKSHQREERISCEMTERKQLDSVWWRSSNTCYEWSCTVRSLHYVFLPPPLYLLLEIILSVQSVAWF